MFKSVWFGWLLGMFFAPSHAVNLPNDAYVWQRVWTPALDASLQSSADLVRSWRVLVAQADARGGWITVQADRTVLAKTQRPVILVVRINGQQKQWDSAALLKTISAVVSDWRRQPLDIAGVEIDYDCATARLPAYADFLGALREALGSIPLSITVLPTWLESTSLDAVLAKVDEAVLQVHAVQSPRRGLFDAQQAEVWITAFSTRSKIPFRVALPTYGSRVSWDENGGLLAVESEMPLSRRATEVHELEASPQDVAGLLEVLRQHPPPRFAGVVWFRLPVAGDRRAWSLATWRAVVTSQPLVARIETVTKPSNVAGTFDVIVENIGLVDADLPSAVTLPSTGCAEADALNGYRLIHNPDEWQLQQIKAAKLRAHRQQIIGWLRCSSEEIPVHALP